MRAVDFWLFILCIQAAISLVNASGIFGNETFFQPDQNEQYQYEIEDINDLVPSEPSFLDYAIMTVTWLWESFLWLVKMGAAFVFIYPTLTNEFMFPAWLSAFFQGLFVAMWIIGYAQWKANRQMKGMY